MSHLTTAERYTIEKLKAMGYGIRKIAAVLKRNASTISRELHRFGRTAYHSVAAAKAAKKRRKASANGYRIPESIKKTVRLLLQKKFSPEQITDRLRLRYKGLRTQLASTQ